MSKKLIILKINSIFVGIIMMIFACSPDNTIKLKIRNPTPIDFVVPPQQVLEILNSFESDNIYDKKLLLFQKGRLELELNEYQKGIQLLEENLIKNENHLPTIELLAIGYRQLYEYKKAKYYYNLAIEKGIKKINVYKQKAQVEFFLREYQSALVSINKVLKEKITPELLLFKAKTLLYKKDTFESKKIIKQLKDMGIKSRALDNLDKSLSPELNE